MDSANEKLKLMLKETGKCFTDLRLKMIKHFNLTYEAFFTEVGIPKETYKKFESGELLPTFEQLLTLGLHTGVNLNWLVYRNGSMFGAREKDMEEILQYIEADETGHYEDFKTLLRVLQNEQIGDFVFNSMAYLTDLITNLSNETNLKPQPD